MREWDRKEIYATRWTDQPEELARACMVSQDLAFTVWLDEPVSCFGALPIWPGVASVWCFGTERFNECGLFLTRFMQKHWIPLLKEAGFHRAQCASIEGHLDAQKWLEALGAERESTQKSFGKNKETFYVYRWLNQKD
jgi:hypothetical protein